MARMRSLPLVLVAWLLCWLAPVSAWAQQLQCNPCNHAFGNVRIGTSTSFSFKLTNTGHKKLYVFSKSIQGRAFSFGHFPLPVTSPAGRSIPVTIRFKPNAAGTASGKAGFISNAVNSPTVVQLTGTGIAPGSHRTDLSWHPGDAHAVGYNICRGTVHGGPYHQINTALDASTNYTDSTVVAGSTYYYVATEVNGQGHQSAYSQEVRAIIPNP